MSDPYQNKLRLRACGVLVEHGSVLLVELRSPVSDQWVWTPPGGGVCFGDSIEATIKREFLEETGLEVEVGEFLFRNELIEDPFHAVELFHMVRKVGGELSIGSDPERSPEDQLIRDVRFIETYKLREMNVVPEYIRTRFR